MSARVDPEVAPQLGARGIEMKEDDGPDFFTRDEVRLYPAQKPPVIHKPHGVQVQIVPEVNPALIGPVWRTLDANRGSMRFHCSACGGIAYWPQAHRGDDKGRRRCGYRICPWCGARMRGTDNGDDD